MGAAQGVKALAGASVLVCATLLLLLGPGPWLSETLGLALVAAAYLGGAWLFLSAARSA